MNSAWKTSKPNPKPAAYSTRRSHFIGNPSAAVMAAAKMMPVASPATQWIVEPTPLFPERRREALVLAGAGLLVGQDVKEEAKRTHVERNEDEAPLHDNRF